MRRRPQRDESDDSLVAAAPSTGASEAMEVIARALEPLAPDARMRVIRATAILLDIDLDAKPGATAVMAPPPAEEAE